MKKFGMACVLQSILAMTAFSATAWAQTYPSKPIRFIVGYTPGGAADILARAVGARINEAWGQAVVVENRAGAGTNIGSELAAKSPPDGYTLFMPTVANAINVTLYPKLAYDPFKDFIYVTNIAKVPGIVVVHPSVPAGSLKELIDLAKARPGVITHASTGPGGAATLAAALFKHTAGIQMLEVPYKSFGAEIPDLMAGHVQVAFEAIAVVGQHIRSGKLRALAVTQARRNSMLPDVPTTTEGGVPGVEATTFSGILTVAGTPAAIVATLHQQFVRALNTPEFREYAAANGTAIGGEPPEEFAAFLSAESAKWGRLIKASGIRME